MPPRDELLLIIDLTSSYVRAGVGVHDLIRAPLVEMSTRIGRTPAVAPFKLSDYVVGPDFDAAEAAGEDLQVIYPVITGRTGFEVADWVGLEALMRYVFHTALHVPRPPLAHPVLVSVPPHLPPLVMDQLHLLFFERLLVPQLLIATRPFLAAAAAGVTAAVILDIGARGEGSEVSTVYDSQPVESATARIDGIDEGVLDDWLAYLLLEEDPSLEEKLLIGASEEDSVDGAKLGEALRALVGTLKSKDTIGFKSPLFATTSSGMIPEDDDTVEGVLDVAKVLVEGKVDKLVKKGVNDGEEGGDFVSIPSPLLAPVAIDLTDEEPEIPPSIQIGAIRHRYLEPLFLPGLLDKLSPAASPTAARLGWTEYATKRIDKSGVQEIIGVVVEQLDTMEEQRAVWEAVVIVSSGRVSANRALGPALIPLLTPFVIDSESGSEHQPKVLHFAKMPDYFSEFKHRGGELGCYLGGCIMAKILISDLQSKMFMAKGEYTTRGPASYRLLEAL